MPDWPVQPAKLRGIRHDTVQHPEWAGWYTHGRYNRTITMGGDTAKGSLKWGTEVIIHEFGHHLDHLFGRLGRVRTRLGPGGSAQFSKMQAEFVRARKEVRLRLGNVDFNGLYETSSFKQNRWRFKRVFSGYGLTNRQEWFAEAFQQYFLKPAYLKRVAPETYKFMDLFVRGDVLPANLPGALKKPVDPLAGLIKDSPFVRGLKKGEFTKRLEDDFIRALEKAHIKRPEFVPASTYEWLEEYVIGSIHRELNQALRGGLRLRPRLQEVVRDLNTASGPLKNPALLFRGVNKNLGYRAGDIVDLDAYTSTTTDLSEALRFATERSGKPTILEIHAGKGTRAAVTNRYEKEFILQPGQKLRIVGTREGIKIDAFGQEFTVRYVVAQVVEEGV